MPTAVCDLRYLMALAIFPPGQFGFFAQASDPLGGVFLVPSGLPSIWLIDFPPVALWPWLAAAMPILNLMLLAGLCHRRSA